MVCYNCVAEVLVNLIWHYSIAILCIVVCVEEVLIFRIGCQTTKFNLSPKFLAIL